MVWLMHFNLREGNIQKNGRTTKVWSNPPPHLDLSGSKPFIFIIALKWSKIDKKWDKKFKSNLNMKISYFRILREAAKKVPPLMAGPLRRGGG